MATFHNQPASASREHTYTKKEIDEMPEAVIPDTPLQEGQYADDEVIDADVLGTVYVIEGENAGELAANGDDYEMVMLDVNGDESMGLTAESDDDTNDVMIVDTLQGIDDYDNYGDQDVYGIEGEMDSTIL